MAGQSTTYKVDIQYDLKGSAASGLRNIQQEATKATSSMGGLKSVLAIAGGAGLFAAGKKALIGFNADIERMKVGLSTVAAMNLKIPFQDGQKAADRLFNTFQKMAAQSPATTKDFVEMANMISGGVLSAGMGLKDLESLTKGAITAASALGAKPEMLALDISQMLAGTVGVKDRYARQLLGGIGETDHTAFNKKSAADRGALVSKAFNQPALLDAANTFGNSFEGVTSTLKDNLELALGQVGLPLFKALTEEVQSWNQWINDNPDKIAKVVGSLGNGLKDAFGIVKEIAVGVFPLIKEVAGVIKDLLSFVVENKDLLINVVKGLLVYKGLQFGGGMMKGGAAGLMGIFKGGVGGMDKLGGLGSAAGDASGGLLSMAGTVVSTLGPLGKFAGLLGGIVALPFLLNPTQKWKDEEARKRAIEIKTSSQFMQAREDVKNVDSYLTKMGIDPNSNVSDTGGKKQEQSDLRESMKTFKAGIIKDAISKGIIKDSVDAAGTRTLSLTGSAGGANTVELIQSVQAIFKDAAAEAWANKGYGMDPTARFTPRMGSDGVGLGYMEEYVGIAKGIDLDTARGPTPPPKVDVNINKIEVYSDDPDRFVAQAVHSFEEVTRNPTQAHEIMRGAF